MSAIEHAPNSSERIVFRPIPLARALALGTGAGLLIVHLLWRVDTTLADLTAAGVTLSILLFAVEAFIAIALTFTAIADIMSAAIDIRPEAVPELDLPSVDVFVLIADPRQSPKAAYSLAAAMQFDYPQELVRLHLVGLDRATDKAEALSALADRMKASWLAASPEATAGSAINAALARTAGSLVLILNAGETPTPDLFRRIAAGFTTNPRLAYCDVPMFAIDGDPVLTDIDIAQRMPNDPGAFFKSCLKTIGAAHGGLGLNTRTVWRRASLSASGSCSRWNLRPDAPARLRAAEAGWHRGIVSRPMIASLAPDTVREYLRGRLAQRIGTIDAALTRDPILAKGLTLRERLSWSPALFAALLPFAWVIAFVVPPLALLLGIQLYGGVGMIEGALIALATLIVALVMSGAMNAGMRGTMISSWSEILETMLSATPLFNLMRKREKTDRVPDPEQANGLPVVIFAIALAGTTAGVAAWYMKPALQLANAPLLALTLFTACLFACLLGAIAEPRQRRLAPRMSRRLEAELLLGGERFAGRLSDISVHGARFMAKGMIDLPARALAGKLTLRSPFGDTVLPVQLSRQTDDSGRSAFGLSFTGRTVGEFATVVRLAHRSGDAYADLCDARAKPAGITRLFASLSVRGFGSFFRRLNPPPRAQTKWIPIRRLSRTMH